MPSPAGPETNKFRCNACGRYLNSQEELREHETECRVAKQSTQEGAAELSHEDKVKHAPNDADQKEFRHGTGPKR